MLFNSLEFLIFFPVVTFFFFILPQNYRWFLLLAASCFFYMAFIPVYILILAVTIVIDYFAGILIENSQGRKRQLYLVVSIISTCLILIIFKYHQFFYSNFSVIARFLNLNYPDHLINIILPIGLSFHTFQSLSYVIEVYRGHQKAERHFGIYSLYVMFYPQLVAGPIERPQNLLHQFREKYTFDYTRVTDGLKLMTWGLFKKAVIADRLAILVNTVYAHPDQFDGILLITATVFFAFQIYCDFSGYSDIAIGAAQVMGFRLMDNFKRPYFAKSIAEFWKRWHISLSTWFKDYLYISLGGNRVSALRRDLNLMITFIVSGFWHGANWTFVIWGALNGLMMVIGQRTLTMRNQIKRYLHIDRFPAINRLAAVLITFILICVTWIFFRARNLQDAWTVFTHLGRGLTGVFSPDYLVRMVRVSGMNRLDWLIALFGILFLLSVHLFQRHHRMRKMLSERPAFIRWSVYFILVLSILFLGVFNRNSFIYFQF